MNKVINIRKATKKDTEDVLNHYRTVIEQIRNNQYNPGWEHNVYPLKEDITQAIDSDELYVGIKDGKIVSSIIINNTINEGYEKLKWNVETEDNEVYYIHLVAVNQNYKKQGLAKNLLKYAFNHAKKNSIKSIRLSIHMNNIAIEPVYTKLGFEYIDTIKVNHKLRGPLQFKVYEKTI